MNVAWLFTILVCSLLMATAVSENGQPNLAPVNNVSEGPSVLLIGLGPAGLSFLHALASKRKRLQEAGDLEGRKALPRVTAVERASVPGGIWREHKNKGDDEYRNMYGDLWTNHPKETFEFSDYTFADHFGREFPPFLRREHVLDYILTRVTRLENVFETNEVYFRTEAKNVRYNKQKGHFVATLDHWEEDESSGNADSKTWIKSSTLNFDKVVWNGGWNGVPRYPKEILSTLDQGGYKGLRLHSLAVDSIPNDAIKNKHIVLIGDNDSANDIAYQMLKRGVHQVVIASRSDKGSASLLPSWPENKVTLLRGYQLTGVTEDGNALVFSTSDVPPTAVGVRDVSAVILCTGYDPNVESLSPELAFALQHLWYLPGQLKVPSSYKRHDLETDSWNVPVDWRMPHNVLTEELAILNGGKEHIIPDLGKAYGSYITNKYLYRNVFMYNTNMFFNHEATYQQLFDIDVSAWLILGYITGEVPIPDLETMGQRNLEDLILQMENPNNRYHLDLKYSALLDELRGNNKEHWYSHGRDTRKRELYRAEFEVQVRFLARDMQDAGYPTSYGNLTHLNKNGVDLIEMSTDFYHNKYWIGHKEEERKLHNPARGWTYRDMECSTYKSLYSGYVSKPFNGHWLDVDNHGCLEDDSPDCGIPRVLKSWDGAFPMRAPPSGLNITDDDDEEEDGITSLFEEAEILNLAVMFLPVILLITFSVGSAFAAESETKSQNSGKSRRFKSIDVLRGLCVFNMIFIHFGEYLSAQWFNQCSLFGTPTFLLVAGMSFHVLSESARRKGEGIRLRAFKRAIFLYLLQAAQSIVLHGNINDIFTCETLMMAGHSQVLLGLLHNVPAPLLAILGILILEETAPFRVALMEFDDYWRINSVGDNVSYDPIIENIQWLDIIHFHVLDGVFPLFPYAAYPLLGLAVGKLIYRPPDQAKSRSSYLKVLAVAGSMILASGVALLVVGRLAPSLIDKSLHGLYMGAWRSWPYETLEHILVSVGRSLLYVVVATKMFDGDFAESSQTSWRGSIHDFFTVFGRFSLTLFPLHHVVLYGILGIGGYATGQSYQAMFENMFEMKTSLVLGVAFLLLTHRLCLWLERKSIPTLEHVQRHFCNLKLVSGSGSWKMSSESVRFQSIDVLRGLCVFNMVFIHFGECLSAQWFNRYSLFGTPTFLLVAGMSFHVLSESAQRKGEGISAHAFKCAMFLYLLAAAQSKVINGDIKDIFSCETLMMTGHSQVLLGMLHKLQAPSLTLLGVTILAVTGYIRDEFMDPDEYWNIDNAGGSVSFEAKTEYLDFNDWEDILQFHFVDGVFPLFPFAAYPILGLAVGKLIYRPLDEAKNSSSSYFLMALTIAGGVALASGIALLAVGKLAPSVIEMSELHGVYFGEWKSWPYESLEHVLVSVGHSLLFVVVATKIFDAEVAERSPSSLQRSIRDFFSVYGRFWLTLFSLHYVVIDWILRIGSHMADVPFHEMVENMFDLKTSLALATVFLLFTNRLCLWLERKSIPTLEDCQGRFCRTKLTVSTAATSSEDETSGDGTVVYEFESSKSRIWRPRVTYEAFMWFVFTLITVLSVVDRFVWNVWPRQVYSIGAGSAGSDRLEGFKPGPWSVVLYDVLARISGRYAIVAYNFLLITRLKSLEYWLMESFASRYLLDCSNIVHANNRLHNYTGIALCVLTLLHVWSILFPCITHGYTAKVIPGVWEWPLSERTPVKCSVEDVPGCWPGDANNDLKQMGLQADDVFRMVEMTLFLMILMPLSVKWLATRWHAAIQLHRIINVVYFVDIVRRHSHPHSWILNTPVFLIYCVDAFVWSNFWRRNNVPEVKREHLGQDYMVLYWVSSSSRSEAIAPHYSIIMKKHAVMEEKHVFTGFENRMDMSIPESETPIQWDAACVIRVFRDRRKPQLGKLETRSHTMRMYEEDPEYIITGPVPGEMSLKVQSAYESSSKPMMLVGSGSAVNYILDFLLWLGCKAKGNGKEITIIYTTRDDDLFAWASASFASVIPKIHDTIANKIELTLSHTGENKLFGEAGLSGALEDTRKSLDVSCHSASFRNTRTDLRDEIEDGMKVFCQGSSAFKSAVKKACRANGASFFGGEGGH